MTKAQLRTIAKAIKVHEFQMIKLLIECWNHPTPHFGGHGPHRYNGKEKTCAYCGRPKTWMAVNPGFIAGEVSEILESEEVES